MSDETLKRLWTSAAGAGGDLESILREGLERGQRSWKLHVWLYLLVLVATAAFGVLNVFGYAQNPAMLAAQLGVTAVAVALLGWGTHVLRELGRIERCDEPIVEALARRLHFHATIFELWLWTTGLSAGLLMFAVTTFIYNEGGRHPINKPLVFWGTLVGGALIVYAAGKLGFAPEVGEMRDSLRKLEAGVDDTGEQLVQRRARVRRGRLIASVALAVLAALGLLLALR